MSQSETYRCPHPRFTSRPMPDCMDPTRKADPMTISVAERAELAAAVSELLHDECTEQDVRRAMDSDDGFDRELWRKLAAQGVTGLLVDSEYGGIGLGALELE